MQDIKALKQGGNGLKSGPSEVDPVIYTACSDDFGVGNIVKTSAFLFAKVSVKARKIPIADDGVDAIDQLVRRTLLCKVYENIDPVPWATRAHPYVEAKVGPWKHDGNLCKRLEAV